jgi:hypothetical protein
MKRVIIFELALVLALSVLGNQAMALKAVSKSSNDSAQAKTPPSTPDKPSDTKPAATPIPPSAGQKPAEPSTPAVPVVPRDNFIDRDGDGINDNIKQHKEPEIKRERTEPSRPVETRQKSESSKNTESKKTDETTSSSKKHK